MRSAPALLDDLLLKLRKYFYKSKYCLHSCSENTKCNFACYFQADVSYRSKKINKKKSSLRKVLGQLSKVFNEIDTG